MSNPTPNERKAKTAELLKTHAALFERLGVEDPNFIPKMAHHVSGLQGIHVGFFDNELEQGDLYIEKVSKQLEPEDPDRTLYKLKYNKFWKEEFTPSDVKPTSSTRYFVPMSDFEVVTLDVLKETDITIPNDPDSDLPLDQMTMRDYAAIQMQKPISNKQWLNDLILK